MKKHPLSGQTLDAHTRAFADLVQSVARRHRLWQIWSDLMEMSATALAGLDRAQFEAREKRYLEIVKRYEPEEIKLLHQAFAELVMAFEDRFTPPRDGEPGTVDFADILGHLYMALDLGNTPQGQFFTPYSVSSLIAQLNLHDVGARIEEKGFITMQEPACGAGGMVIACAQSLAESGYNYQKVMHATAVDINITCVHMTFVQCALLHIPAVVVHGNTLTMDCHSQWFTPAHILGNWSARLRHAPRNALIQAEAEPVQIELPRIREAA